MQSGAVIALLLLSVHVEGSRYFCVSTPVHKVDDAPSSSGSYDPFLNGPLTVIFALGKEAVRAIRNRSSSQVVKDVKDAASVTQNKPSLGEQNLNSELADKKPFEQSLLNRALWKAAERGRDEEVRRLLKAGADVNSRDVGTWYQCSALHYAAVDGHVSVVETLIRAGADVNVQDWDQWTPLHYAAFQGLYKHARVAKTLLDAGADVREQTWDGKTALTIAERNKHQLVENILSEYIGEDIGVAKSTTNKPTSSLLDECGVRRDRGDFLQRLASFTHAQ